MVTPVVLPASKTKTRDLRVLPVLSELRAVLEMRRTDPAGQPLPPEAYVFGNAVGQRRVTIKTAWRNTCRRAGITDLHFHDLRREFACRLLESSAELHNVRDFLGHANISTTSRYLQSSSERLADALQRLEVATSEKFAHRSHKPTDQAARISGPDQKRPVLQG